MARPAGLATKLISLNRLRRVELIEELENEARYTVPSY